MMAAIVSSLDLISVGPNTTPRLLACIRFCFELAATLHVEIKDKALRELAGYYLASGVKKYFTFWERKRTLGQVKKHMFLVLRIYPFI
jgi:hypothetical protein